MMYAFYVSDVNKGLRTGSFTIIGFFNGIGGIPTLLKKEKRKRGSDSVSDRPTSGCI